MTAIVTPKHYDTAGIKDVPTVTSGGTALPSGSAFMLPQIVLWNGQHYDCTQAGLYVFQQNGGIFQKRIVAWNGSSLFDIYEVMSAFSWNHTHGWSMDGYAYGTTSSLGRTQKWRLTCGKIAGLCNWYFNQVGVTSRIINVSTDGALNGYDDGHIIIETLHGSDWRMWDMTNGCYFVDSNGDHMDTASFIAQIANGGAFPTKVYLHNADKSSAETINGFCHSTFYELTQKTEAQKEEWYRRIFQKVL